jgi:hypothetical protein
MIKCEGGSIEFSGDAIQLTAEMSITLNGFINVLVDNNLQVDKASNALLKSLIYNFTKQAAKAGFETSFSPEEIANFERLYNEVYGDD